MDRRSVKKWGSGEDSGEECNSESFRYWDVANEDAGLPLTQSDDPLSGGHFDLGTSKPPPRSARERSGVIVHVVVALHVADG